MAEGAARIDADSRSWTGQRRGAVMPDTKRSAGLRLRLIGLRGADTKRLAWWALLRGAEEVGDHVPYQPGAA